MLPLIEPSSGQMWAETFRRMFNC